MPHKKRNPRPTVRRSRSRDHPLANYRVTVVDLGGVGRQVALQLASLGVRRLQLVDPRVVGRRTHAAEGYAEEDIGRLKAHAVAQACHQLNPELEIHAAAKRSLRGLKVGDAVICCPGSDTAWTSLSRMLRGSDLFAARCSVTKTGGWIHAGSGPELWKACLECHPRVNPQKSAEHSVMAVCSASVISGMVVAAFARFATGDRSRQTIRLDSDT